MKQTTPFTVEVRKKRRLQEHEAVFPWRAVKTTDEARSVPEGENTAPNEIAPQNDPAGHRTRTRRG